MIWVFWTIVAIDDVRFLIMVVRLRQLSGEKAGYFSLRVFKVSIVAF
jgi:hypothetical protein